MELSNKRDFIGLYCFLALRDKLAASNDAQAPTRALMVGVSKRNVATLADYLVDAPRR